MTTVPYFYIIKHKTSGKKYAGCRAKVSASKVGRKRIYRNDGTYYMSKAE